MTLSTYLDFEKPLADLEKKIAELETAGAYRVYDGPADLLLHLDEVGVRGAV